MPTPLRNQLGCAGAGWQRATQPLRRHWATINAPCALCDKTIDYTLPPAHRMALTVDHRIPVWAGGPPLDPTNWQPAHRSCNSSRGAKDNAQRRARRPQPLLITDLTWPS